jgi:hypothetical protein
LILWPSPLTGALLGFCPTIPAIPGLHKVVFTCVLTLAHPALATAASLALTAGLLRRSPCRLAFLDGDA